MVSAAELQRLHEQANGANNASVALGGQAAAPMADPFPSLSEDPFPAAKPVDTNGSAAGVVGAARQSSKANTQSSQPDLYVCIRQTAPVFIIVPNAFVLLSPLHQLFSIGFPFSWRYWLCSQRSVGQRIVGSSSFLAAFLCRSSSSMVWFCTCHPESCLPGVVQHPFQRGHQHQGWPGHDPDSKEVQEHGQGRS